MTATEHHTASANRASCATQIFIIDWQGLAIEIRYCSDSSKAYRDTYGYSLAHLEVETLNRYPLPITATGYVNHYQRASCIDEAGGAVAYVLAWLNHAANASRWIVNVEDARQYSLF